MDHNDNGSAILFGIALLYFLPSIIASARRHQSAMAIFMINLLLGWTALFWLIAFILSLTNAGANERKMLAELRRIRSDVPQAVPFDGEERGFARPDARSDHFAYTVNQIGWIVITILAIFVVIMLAANAGA